MVLLDNADALEVWGIGLGVKAFCAHLSLPASMLANTGLFPFSITSMGICGTVEGVASCLGIHIVVLVEQVLLVLPDSSISSDVAVHITNFRAVVGFVTEPDLPSIPNLVAGVYPVAEGVCCASTMVAFFGEVEMKVDVQGEWI